MAADININFLQNSKEHNKLTSVLRSHNMNQLVNFPTRVCQNSETAIDNILISSNLCNSVMVTGVVTCLSDPDGQFIELRYPSSLFHTNIYKLLFKKVGVFNKSMLPTFQS